MKQTTKNFSKEDCVAILMTLITDYFVEADLECTDLIYDCLLQVVKKNLLILSADPKNKLAQAEMQQIIRLKPNSNDSTPMMIAQTLSEHFEQPLGTSLALVWPNWARYVYKDRLDHFVRFSVTIMDIEPRGTREEIVLKGIHAVENFCRTLNVPTTLAEAGLHLNEFEREKIGDSREVSMILLCAS